MADKYLNSKEKWGCVAICNDQERSRRLFGGTCLPIKSPYPITVFCKGGIPKECYILDVKALPDAELSVLAGALSMYFKRGYQEVRAELLEKGALIFAEDITVSYPFEPKQIPQLQYSLSF